jgi:hypothetical protein
MTLESAIMQAREISRVAEAEVIDLEAERTKRGQERAPHLAPAQPDVKQREQAIEQAMRERAAAASVLERAELAISQRANEADRWREAHPMRAWLHDRGLLQTRLLIESARWIERAGGKLPALRERLEEAHARLEVARERAGDLSREAPGRERERGPERERNGRERDERHGN